MHRIPYGCSGIPDKAAISVYAQNKDYHVVIKKIEVACTLVNRRSRWYEVKAFVDTAPVPENP